MLQAILLIQRSEKQKVAPGIQFYKESSELPYASKTWCVYLKLKMMQVDPNSETLVDAQA